MSFPVYCIIDIRTYICTTSDLAYFHKTVAHPEEFLVVPEYLFGHKNNSDILCVSDYSRSCNH
jgi:hypothetical protein